MPRSLLEHTVGQLARSVDRAFAQTALRPSALTRGSSRAESLSPAARLRALSLVRAFYAGPDTLEREGRFLPRPERISPTLTRVRRLGSAGEVLDLRWPSEFEPLWSVEGLQSRLDAMGPEELVGAGLPARPDATALLRELGIDRRADLREKYLRARGNQTAHARWFRHADGPRPCAVVLHGYLGGNYAIEERVWPVRRLFEGGLDVVLTVLPLHGPRRSEARGLRPPAFPSSDPRFTIEGLRQLVFDHRALFDYLRAGATTGVGLMGMSLGGFGAALLSTLEADLRFSVLWIPLAGIELFAHEHGRMNGDVSEQLAQRDALTAAQWSVSPLARPSLVPSDRVVIVAGEHDRVTGLPHAHRLAAHFGAPVSRFAGSHLLMFGRERAFEPVWSMLEHEGYRPAVKP
ncbi:MAG TPA: hypothetical protein VJV78_43800 [Polyangiales bacterium]|nr:hypothetical protein [Polyangiales bacterium]